MSPDDRYHLTAPQAAAALGISRASLYAYASRGQLRSEPVPHRPKERRYFREDIERLRERKDVRSDPARAAARGLHWGGPVLESGVTLIHEGRFYYRGRDAIGLARTSSLEQVAALLWGVSDRELEAAFTRGCRLPDRQWSAIRSLATGPDGSLAAIQSALPAAGSFDLASYDVSPVAVGLTGARIMRLVTDVIGGQHSAAPIHIALQAKWAPKQTPVSDVLRRALVLCADHELNVSAFTARCAASAGASPYHVVSAALAAFRGYKHGGAAQRVLTLLDEAKTAKSARELIVKRLQRGDHVPGFGHRLYPSGDPRATELLHVAKAGRNARAWRDVHGLLRAGSELLHDLPNIDFALAAITRTYGLPAEAPALLFALGRTAGWIAHAIEQYRTGELIRPRARYTGPAPALT